MMIPGTKPTDALSNEFPAVAVSPGLFLAGFHLSQSHTLQCKLPLTGDETKIAVYRRALGPPRLCGSALHD